MTSVEGGRWIPPAPRPTRRRFRRPSTAVPATTPDTATENPVTTQPHPTGAPCPSHHTTTRNRGC
jgi:hypothetical protein